MKKPHFPENNTVQGILANMLIAFVSLFVNGFGVYLTIRAGIGSAPYDVLNIGISKTFGILYGTASIAVSAAVIVIDVLLRERIGIAIVIDALTVGKAVDFFNWIDAVPVPKTTVGSVALMTAGLFVLGYTQYFYMRAALGCGPRDTMLVGITRLLKKVPIGIVGIIVQSAATLTGWLLGGPVGLGTIICAFGAGPVMQFAFFTVKFDATGIRHQNFFESAKVIFGKK